MERNGTKILVTGMEGNGTEIPVRGTKANGMYWLNPMDGTTYKIPFRSTGVWTERNGKLVPDNGTGYKPRKNIRTKLTINIADNKKSQKNREEGYRN